MFSFHNNYYYIIIGLQAICVIHCISKGRQNNWIWLLIFLPLVGCLIYIFTEIFTRRDMHSMQSGVSSILNPKGSVRKLEETLRFSDTFANRVQLADAYLASGNTDGAIGLYESSLTGNFAENEYVLRQLVIAYYQKKRYSDIIPIAKKIYPSPQFPRSRAHILYAAALGYLGDDEAAEKEFKTMKGRFGNYEARYYYALLLAGTNRVEEARRLFSEMLDEVSQLSSRERRYNRQWLQSAREELKKLSSYAVTG
jgi:hypothetical protein